MTTSRVIATAVIIASLTMSAAAAPTSIGVFFNPDATDCDASVVPNWPVNLYVSAVLGTDAAGPGITGATFRVDGLAGIVRSVTPNPAAFVSLGDPATPYGCDIAFPACMTGEGQQRVVLLYTIECFSSQPIPPRTVSVQRTSRACDACCRFAPCVTLCDAVYTYVYVPGGQALINNGSCTVAVQAATWSAVKSLFTANSVLQPAGPQARQR
jgi:hypothetical protein